MKCQNRRCKSESVSGKPFCRFCYDLLDPGIREQLRKWKSAKIIDEAVKWLDDLESHRERPKGWFHL